VGQRHWYGVNARTFNDSVDMLHGVGLGMSKIITIRPEIIGQVLAVQEGQERDG
jgi:hypothetical protein